MPTIPIGPDRGDLPLVPLGEDEEWVEATLHVKAAAEVTFSPADLPGSPTTWVSASWDHQRPLTGVSLAYTPEAYSMLKVATGGVWFTPIPPGRLHKTLYQPICAFNDRELSFPPITANAVLIEFNDGDPHNEKVGLKPKEVKVAKLEVTVLNPVIDLIVRVGERQPVGQIKGRLPSKGQPFNLLEGLRAAPPGSAIQLRAAQVADVTYTLTTKKVRRPRDLPEEPATQTVRFGDAARWTQPLGKASALQRVSGVLECAIRPQRVVGEELHICDQSVQLLAPGRRVAQRLPLLRQVAEAFLDSRRPAGSPAEPSRAPEYGLDLWIEAEADSRGRVSVHRDDAGRPEEHALVSSEWEMKGNTKGWIGVSLDSGHTGGLWVVLELDEGLAYAPRTTLFGALVPALQASGGRPWTELEPYLEPAEGDAQDTRLHLCLRVRKKARSQPPLSEVVLTRGEKSITLQPETAAFELTQDQLQALGSDGEQLKVTARSSGVGAVTLRDWVVRLEAD